MGPLVRCHVAIRLPQAVIPKLQETQMNIRRKSASDVSRWSAPSELILSLCAFGEQPWEMVKRASGVLAPLCSKYPALNLRLEGISGLPNNNQPRFVAANIAGDVERLVAMQAEMARALAPVLSPTEKAYVPQVVLGRLRVESEQARTALGRAVRMIPSEVLGEWTAGAVEIVRADAGSAGLQYQTVETFPLGAQEPANA